MRMVTRLLLFLVCSASLSAQTPVRREITLFHPPEGVHNLLDPETMAVDSWRSEVYVASASQSRITAFSTISADALLTRTGENGLPAPVRLLGTDPLNRRVFCTLRGAYPRQSELLAYDFNAGAIAKATDMGPCERLDVIADTRLGLLYASTGREHILILDLESLALIDSIHFDAPCGGLAFDSSHNELYAAQALPVRGISRIKKYNTSNRELIRSIQFPATEPYDRIECDPQSGNVVAFSQGAVRSFDAFGQAVYEYGINDGVRSTARSAQYRRAYIADMRGARTGERAGTKGRIHMLGFEGIEIDSLEFQFPVADIAVCELSRTIAVLSYREQLVYLMDLADYRDLADILLGKRAESAAALDSQPLQYASIAVTNPSSLSAGFINHRILEGRDTEHQAGFLTVDVEPLNGTRGYAALSQGSGDLYIYDSLGAIVATIPTGAYAGTSDRQPSIVASHEGLDHVIAVFPEFSSYAVFDARNHTMLWSDFIDGLTTLNGSGKGSIQACFVPGGDEYCILRLDDQKLNVYSRSNFSLVRELDLSMLQWDTFAAYERFALQRGRDNGTINIGPYIIHTDGQHDPELTHSFIVVYLAHYSNGYSAVLTDGNVAIIEGNVVKQPLEIRQNSIPDDVFTSHDGTMILFSFAEDATVVSVRVENITSIPDLPKPAKSELDLFPNPVSHSGTLSLASDINVNGHATEIIISDISGRVMRTIQLPLSNGTVSYPVSALVPAPGIYVIRTNLGNNNASTLFVVTP